MIKNVVLYVFVLLSFTSCLDQEKSNYNLKYESYKIDGVYIKDCAGEPIAGATLRLYTPEERDLSLKILAQTTTDSEGLFSLSYLLETTTYRYRYSDLLIYSYNEITKEERLISNRLPWQQDLFVDLIQNIEDTTYFYTTGLNQLTTNDTLFIKGREFTGFQYSKYFVGPFPDGRLLDSIRQPFTNYNTTYYDWSISDTCKYSRSSSNQLRCNFGNYGLIDEVVPYCERLNIKIDLSNALN
jgi:hypothetical protein